jgi:hypothetical protein
MSTIIICLPDFYWICDMDKWINIVFHCLITSMFSFLISFSSSHILPEVQCLSTWQGINRPQNWGEAHKIWGYSSTIYQYKELIIHHPTSGVTSGGDPDASHVLNSKLKMKRIVFPSFVSPWKASLVHSNLHFLET